MSKQTAEQIVDKIREGISDNGEIRDKLTHEEAVALITAHVEQVAAEKDRQYDELKNSSDPLIDIALEASALRTICAKQKEALNYIYDFRNRFCETTQDMLRDAIALTPATVADELAALQQQLSDEQQKTRLANQSVEAALVINKQQVDRLAEKDRRIAELKFDDEMHRSSLRNYAERDEYLTKRAESAEAKMASATYHSTQHTCCAVCGQDKHTPLRNDNMGGYVCLTCIDKELFRQADEIATLRSKCEMFAKFILAEVPRSRLLLNPDESLANFIELTNKQAIAPKADAKGETNR